MKRLILAVSAMILLSLAGWGQNSPREQDSHAKVARRIATRQIATTSAADIVTTIIGRQAHKGSAEGGFSR